MEGEGYVVGKAAAAGKERDPAAGGSDRRDLGAPLSTPIKKMCNITTSI
jgi:hypothetical protein